MGRKKTFLEGSAIDWNKFLKEIDEGGLDGDSTIIGIELKEREMMQPARLFPILSWKLREYFAVTEHLIQEQFFPLILKSAEKTGVLEVTRRQARTMNRQGPLPDSLPGVPIHLGATVFPEVGRHKSMLRVYQVVDSFLGFKNLVRRTNEIFE